MRRQHLLATSWIVGSFAAAVLGLSGRLAAQDDHHFHYNDIGVFVGGTTPLDADAGGKTSFTLGADYERRFTAVVGIEVIGEFVIGDHKRTWLLALALTARPIEPLRIAAGPGVEWVEKDVPSGTTTTTKYETHFLVATRVNYVFHVGKFIVSPTFGVDFIGETKTNLVYGLTLGYGF